MSIQWFVILSLVFVFVFVFGDNTPQNSLFCRNSTINGITYVQSTNQHFVVSEDYYWFVDKFPLKSGEAHKFPKPFSTPSAVVFIDTFKQCKSGTTPHSKIWVFELIGKKQMIHWYDITDNKFDTNSRNLIDDKCMSRVKDIDLSEPIDAVFTLNNFDIFVVQKDSYSMIDCNFLCSPNSNDYGKAYNAFKLKDVFKTTEPIEAIFSNPVENYRQKLFVFQKKTYFTIEVKRESNGKLTPLSAPSKSMDILKDFLKEQKEFNCSESETTEPTVTEGPKESSTKTKPQTESTPKETTENPVTEESKSGLNVFLIVIIIVIIFTVLCVVVVVFIVVKKGGSKRSKRKSIEMPEKPSSPSKPDSKVLSEIVTKNEPKEALKPSASKRSLLITDKNKSLPKSSSKAMPKKN